MVDGRDGGASLPSFSIDLSAPPRPALATPAPCSAASAAAEVPLPTEGTSVPPPPPEGTSVPPAPTGGISVPPPPSIAQPLAVGAISTISEDHLVHSQLAACLPAPLSSGIVDPAPSDFSESLELPGACQPRALSVSGSPEDSLGAFRPVDAVPTASARSGGHPRAPLSPAVVPAPSPPPPRPCSVAPFPSGAASAAPLGLEGLQVGCDSVGFPLGESDVRQSPRA